MRILAVAGVLCLASAAGATVLDFEGPPTGPINGDEYVAFGVLFGGQTGAQEVDYGGEITEIITSGDWYTALDIIFVLPGDGSTNAFTDYVAMQNHWGPGGPGGGTDEWTATSYDLGGNPIETKELIGDGWLIFDTGSIHMVVLDDMNNTAFAMDNLTFNTPIIPEPTGITVAGLGIMGLIAWRRRR